ncbi:MAG: glycosyltransferase family 2 protein [Phycisphaerales bacterium]|nr:glycosyltransferase family 2 protein [Phycisphaerales bacterium]
MHSEVDLSILMPVKNRVKLTRACLASLFETASTTIKLEILVQDNGSTDGTLEYLESLGERVRVLRGTDSHTFAKSNNEMAHAARGRALCMLNNDTVLLDGWIEPMLAVLDREPSVGVVGNVQLFPGDVGVRRINHAGVVFTEDRMPVHLYEGMGEDLAAAMVTREMQAVTAACSMIRKEVFLKLDGFDESFRNGHEDIDLCLRARAAGYANWIAGESRIVHYGSSTPGRLSHDDQNTRLFFDRHGGVIEPDLERVTAGDGVDWPARSWSYRVVRMLWRYPPIRFILKRLMRTTLGMRLRQFALHRLSRSGK